MTRTITRLLILASVAVALAPLAGPFVQSTYASGVSAAASRIVAASSQTMRKLLGTDSASASSGLLDVFVIRDLGVS